MTEDSSFRSLHERGMPEERLGLTDEKEFDEKMDEIGRQIREASTYQEWLSIILANMDFLLDDQETLIELIYLESVRSTEGDHVQGRREESFFFPHEQATIIFSNLGLRVGLDPRKADHPRDPISGGIMPDTTIPYTDERTGKRYFDHDRGPNAEAARRSLEALRPEMEALELLSDEEMNSDD